jgi:hypothetical protein
VARAALDAALKWGPDGPVDDRTIMIVKFI